MAKRERRRSRAGWGGSRPERGFTVWFTGLSGSGKTTLSRLLCERLMERGHRNVEVLDGDVVRTHLSKGLGFSREDRDTNIRRIGWVAQLLTRHGVPTLVAAISPYREARGEVRKMVEAVGGPGCFVEVFVDCRIEVCAQRDVTGLYEKARRGELQGFTGVDDPYEPPLEPELHLQTDRQSAEECVDRILTFLEGRDLLARKTGDD